MISAVLLSFKEVDIFMYENLRICCRTCGFNGFNENSVKDSPEKAGDFFCKVRQFELKYPTWTLCKNHPIYNPLRVMEPRGPIWAAVNIIYDSQPLNADVMIPPEFVPPQGDGTHFFIPYFENVRPAGGRGGMRTVWQISAADALFALFGR